MTAEPSRPLCVLKVSDVYFPRINGVSTSLETFRRALEAQGHEVRLVAPGYPGHHPGEPSVHRVQSRYLPLDPEDRVMRRRALGWTLAQVAEAHPPDLIHVHTPFLAHYAGLALGRRLGVPVVATYHTFFEEYLQHYLPALLPRTLLRAVARRFSRRQCNALDWLVVPSAAMARRLEHYGVTTPRSVIPTGLPPEAFRRGDGRRFRERLGIPAEAPVVLNVSRLAHEKNIDFLLRAVARLRGRFPGLVFVLTGEGPAQSHLRALAWRLGLAESMRFVGYLDRRRELPDCYRAADLFLFASRTETQGLVLLEAMAQGVPVVSTAVMGTADIAGPERGAVAPPEDDAAFAEAVAGLLADPARRKRLGEEAVAFAAGWDASRMAGRLAELYRGLLAAESGDSRWL